MALCNLGFPVDTVATCVQAHRMVMADEYAVVLLDASSVRDGDENPILLAAAAGLATTFVVLQGPAPMLGVSSLGGQTANVVATLHEGATQVEIIDRVRQGCALAAARRERRTGVQPCDVTGDVLLVTASTPVAGTVREHLRSLQVDQSVRHITSPERLGTVGELNAFGLALVDLGLPMCATDVVRALVTNAPELPIVMLASDEAQEPLADQALLVGAQEVLQVADGRTATFRAIHRALLRKQADLKMRYRINHDGLTGLYNASRFRERVAECVTRVHRDSTAAALLYLDLDGFKPVNDGHGHAAGDQVLRVVGARLQEVVRGGDVAARLGGDEFAVLLEDVYDRKVVRQVVERVLRSISSPITLSDGESVRVTASVGVALCPDCGDTEESLIEAADRAMFEAKRLGSNQSIFAADVGKHAGDPRARLLGELRQAAQNGGFFVVFQPQLDLRTRSIVGLEALVRWQRPDGRKVGPGEFVPMLEHLGLIGTVGAFVLTEACRHAQAWTARRGRPVRVAVNVSPVQLEDPGFLELVCNTLQRFNLAPELLELEVTEGTLMCEGGRVRSTLRALREHGVRIALDDFGTGYAALSYLREFPLDAIKIDRSFIAPLAHDSKARILVGAIIDLARQLGLQVLAEGVEDARQLAYLRERGCDACQGYLFGKPHFTGHIRDLLH